MKISKILTRTRNIEKKSQQLLEKLSSHPILDSQEGIYSKTHKAEIVALWEEYSQLFLELQKLIKLSKYRKYFFRLDYNKLVLKKYLLVTYFNTIIEFDSIAGEHKEFLCILIRDNYSKNYGYFARYIYRPRHINIINTPNIFLEVFKTFMNAPVRKLLLSNMIEVQQKYRIQADYNNIYFYIKYYFDRALFYIVRIVGNIIARTRFSRRVEGLITAKNIQAYLKIAQIGDICLTRGNWNASNISIPGFWKHMSMYVGTGKYLHQNFNILQKLDSKSHYIIESVGDGVRLVTIEKMLAHNDYLGVSRTNFSEDKIARTLQNSFENLGKGYDFIFSFYSDKNLVCSELVMKSYAKEYEADEGIEIQLEHIGVGLAFPPNNFMSLVKQSPYLEPVFFIDSIEKTGENFISTPDKFLRSRKRPRFSFLLD